MVARPSKADFTLVELLAAPPPRGSYRTTSWNEGRMPVGTYQVMIQPAAGAGSGDEPSPEDLLDNPEKFEQAGNANFPFKYRQTNSSGLEFPVTEGENTIDIDIKSS